MEHGPFHQFIIQRYVPIQIGGVDASYTNASLWMTIVLLVIMGLMVLSVRGGALVPSRMQSVAEMAYEFVANMVRDNAGHEGMKYFPFVLSLFLFILFCNLLGLIPYSFTPTSHIVVTFAMAAFVFIGVTIIAFIKHGVHFFSFFAPKGVPLWLMPILVPIEIISYLIRPLTLSVRLFANMLAGHIMLKVFAGFVIMMGLLFGWLPLIFTSAFFALEVLVACLQAYVFAILTCLYLNDALHLHH